MTERFLFSAPRKAREQWNSERKVERLAAGSERQDQGVFLDTRHFQDVFVDLYFLSERTNCVNRPTFLLFQTYSREMRELKSKVQTFTEEKDSMMGEHTELQKQKAKLECDLGDISSELDGESSQKVNLTAAVLTCAMPS